MKRFLFFIVLLPAILLACHPVQAQEEFIKIRQAIGKSLLNEQTVAILDKTIPAYMASLKPSGYWTDIDYASTQRTAWPAGQHLERVQTLAKGFADRQSAYYKNSQVYRLITAALQYWYSNDYKSTNWWHNEIATPQSLGEIMILLKEIKPLKNTLQKALLVRMNRGQMWQQTGANKLDVALHNIYRASLLEDSGLMDSAVREAFQPISFTTGEGLQYDLSNLQHGPQMMIGSYGFVFVNGEYKVASFLQDTRYAIPADKLRLLSAYFYEVFLKAIRGSFMDFNTEGRGLSRRDVLDKRITIERRSLDNLLHIAMMLDKPNKPCLKAARERLAQQQDPSFGITPYHRHFWKADYDLHLRPAYSFNVRTVSSHTLRTETGNDENLLGNFLPDGATDIQRRGAEYNNIQPVWEWDKIPGTTAHDYDTDEGFRPVKDWGIRGSTAFAGGVSDSIYGAAAYDMAFDSITARKAWFFFDREVVCLGAGISSNTAVPVTTSINQCWLYGDVMTSDAGSLPAGTSQALTNPAWVWHDSIAYFFPNGGRVHVSNRVQSGEWYRINKAQPKGIMSGAVFKLWIDHLRRPADSSYAYIVVPGIGKDNLAAFRASDVTILQNSKDLQAVMHKGLGMLQVVFYKAGTLSYSSFSLTVDKPCMVYIKKMSGKVPVLYIADPLQDANAIHVRWKRGEETVKEIYCRMPEGVWAGSTFRYDINQ